MGEQCTRTVYVHFPPATAEILLLLGSIPVYAAPAAQVTLIYAGLFMRMLLCPPLAALPASLLSSFNAAWDGVQGSAW